MTGEVFIDTGVWVALLRKNDARHRDAAREWKRLTRDRARLMTSSFVLSESATRLRYDAGLPAALALRDRMRIAGSRGLLRLVWVDEQTVEAGWQVMEKYPDLALSLTDATSAAVCRRMKIHTICGFDSDFRVMGFDVRPSG